MTKNIKMGPENPIKLTEKGMHNLGYESTLRGYISEMSGDGQYPYRVIFMGGKKEPNILSRDEFCYDVPFKKEDWL